MEEAELKQLAKQYRALSKKDQIAFVKECSDEEAFIIQNLWEFRAREKQIVQDGDWFVYLWMTGRGFGKTLSECGWVDGMARANPGCRIALVGPTAADTRDVMVQGESGILNIAPIWDKPKYSPTYRRVQWSNGSTAWLYSAEEPERLRGPQHHFAACDEIGAWFREDTWDMLMFGMRLGTDPKIVAGTTPRPTALIHRLVNDKKTVVISGSTLENRQNLAKPFVAQILARYGGTRLGKQEIEGVLLEELIGALWKEWMFSHEGFRVDDTLLPPLRRKVVSIDPAVSTNDDSNETGIIVAGAHYYEKEGSEVEMRDLYVLADLSMSAGPETWARAAIQAYYAYGCDLIVAEINNGGNLVGQNIASIDPNVPFKALKATEGKQARAEPISLFYAQNRAHHTRVFKELEDQMLDWIPGKGASPDRIDALCWAGHELLLGEPEEAMVPLRTGIARFTSKLRW